MNKRHQRVVRELTNIKVRRFAADSLRLRRRELETDALCLVSGERIPEPSPIVACAHLRQREEALRATVAHVERALDALPLPQNTILRAMYVDEREGAVAWLVANLHVSRSSLYRTRDRALTKLADMLGVES